MKKFKETMKKGAKLVSAVGLMAGLALAMPYNINTVQAEEISEVALTIDAPEAGKAFDTEAESTTNGVTTGEITWYFRMDATSEFETVTNLDRVECGVQYKVEIPLSLEEGNEWGESISSMLVNGYNAEVVGETDNWKAQYIFAQLDAHVSEEDDSDCTTAVKCSVCEAVMTEAAYEEHSKGEDGICEHEGCNVICEVALDIEVPTPGGKGPSGYYYNPNAAFTDGTPDFTNVLIPGNVVWTLDGEDATSDVATCETTYTATVALTVAEGYKWTNASKVYVNGAAEPATVTYESGVATVVCDITTFHKLDENDHNCSTEWKCSNRFCQAVVEEVKEHIDTNNDGECDNENCTCILSITLDLVIETGKELSVEIIGESAEFIEIDSITWESGAPNSDLTPTEDSIAKCNTRYIAKTTLKPKEGYQFEYNVIHKTEAYVNNSLETTWKAGYKDGIVSKQAQALTSDHIPSADDGDCTTDILCSVEGCGVVVTEGKTQHVDTYRDGMSNTDNLCDNTGCKTILSLDVDIAAPEAGKPLATEVDSSLPDEEKVTATVTWPDAVLKEGNAKCETPYTVQVVFDAEEYKFNGDSTKVTINGEDATSVSYDKATGTITATYTFAALEHIPNEDDGDCTTAVKCSVCEAVTTEAQEHKDDDTNGLCDNEGCKVILKVALDIEAPVGGETTFNTSATFTDTTPNFQGILTLGRIEWTLDGEPVNTGFWASCEKTYTATIKLTVKEGYKWTDASKVYVNSSAEPAMVTYEGNVATVTCDFTTENHKLEDDDYNCSTERRCSRTHCGKIVEAAKTHNDANNDGLCDNNNCKCICSIDITLNFVIEAGKELAVNITGTSADLVEVESITWKKGKPNTATNTYIGIEAETEKAQCYTAYEAKIKLKPVDGYLFAYLLKGKPELEGASTSYAPSYTQESISWRVANTTSDHVDSDDDGLCDGCGMINEVVLAIDAPKHGEAFTAMEAELTKAAAAITIGEITWTVDTVNGEVATENAKCNTVYVAKIPLRINENYDWGTITAITASGYGGILLDDSENEGEKIAVVRFESTDDHENVTGDDVLCDYCGMTEVSEIALTIAEPVAGSNFALELTGALPAGVTLNSITWKQGSEDLDANAIAECATEYNVGIELQLEETAYLVANPTTTVNGTETGYGADGNTRTITLYVTFTTSHTDEEKSNDICDICDELMPDALEAVTKCDLVLNGKIAVRFYAKLAEELVYNDSTKMVFTLPNSTEPVEVALDNESVEYDSEKDMYIFPCEVAAKEMTDSITAQVYAYDEPVDEKSYTFSVQDYAQAVLSDTEGNFDANTIAFVKALLNYGAYAQTYFEYETEKLANSILAENERNLEELTANTLKVEGYAPDKDGYNTEVCTFASARLALETETSIRVMVKLADGVDSTNAEFYIDDKKVENPVKSGDYYLLTVENVQPSKLDEVHTFKVSVDGQESQLGYSALSYCYSVLNGNNGAEDNVALENVVKALYELNAAANAYAGEN